MTDGETKDYFAVNDNFGLTDVRFFSQGVLPTTDQDGKALLRDAGALTNPDGHGGCFTALVNSGLLADLAKEGVEYLLYIQVDNILAPVDDEIFVGTAEKYNADVVTKVLPKANPDEKVGHLVRQVSADGATCDRIVEYTELTPEQTRLNGADGQPIFAWGSPGLFAWRVSFMAQQAEAGYISVPHRSKKPIKAWVDGEVQEVNGLKCERFLFDLLAKAPQSVGLEIVREHEFAPVKNKEGVDSAVSAKQLANDLYRDWLASVGVTLANEPEQLIEISPRFAATREQFQAVWDGRVKEIRGEYYLEVE